MIHLKKYLLITLCLVGNFIIPMEESNINLEEVKSRPKRKLSEIQEEELPAQKKQKPFEAIAFKNDVNETVATREVSADQAKMLKAISTVINDIPAALIEVGVIPIYQLSVDIFDQFSPFIESVYQLQTAKKEDKEQIQKKLESQINDLSFSGKLNILKVADYLIIPLFKDTLIKSIAKNAQNRSQLEMFKNKHQEWQAQYENISDNLRQRITQAILQPNYSALLTRLQIIDRPIHTELYMPSVAWSPDGTKLASGSDDKVISIWDGLSGDQLTRFETQLGIVNSISWSPDGVKFVTGSSDKTVRIWNSVTGESLQVFRGHTSSVQSVAWSPDGSKIASGSWDNTIRIWNSESGQLLNTLTHTDRVESVVWSPDGSKLASGSMDKTVRIWNSEGGQLLNTLIGHTGLVYSVAWSPDGLKIASGSRDGTLLIWNSRNGQLLNTLKGDAFTIQSVAWSPDSTKIACGLWNDTIHIWDSVSGELLKTIRTKGSVFSVAWSPDNTKLASGGWEKIIYLWDIGLLNAFFDALQHSNLSQVLFIIVAFSGEQWGNNDSMIAIFNTLSDSIKKSPVFARYILQQQREKLK